MFKLTRPTFGGRLIRRIPVAKKNVVEITCDRCDRTEYVDPSTYNVHADLELYFGPRKGEHEADDIAGHSTCEILAHFNDLCSSCRKTVKNLSEQIAKKISWKRNKGGEEELDDKKGGPAVPPSTPTLRLETDGQVPSV